MSYGQHERDAVRVESSDQIKATLKLELIGSLVVGVAGEMKR